MTVTLTRQPSAVIVPGTRVKKAWLVTLLNEIIDGIEEGGGADGPSLTDLINHKRIRPGDGKELFASTYAGEGNTLTDAVGTQTINADGKVLRLVGQNIVAAREAVRIEPLRIYRARAAFRRAVNSTDPDNDAVELCIAWLDGNKAVQSVEAVNSIGNASVGGGRYILTQYIATADDGQIVQTVAPAGAIYARVFVKAFGFDGQLDVEVVSLEDVTEQAAQAITDESLAQAIQAATDAENARDEAEGFRDDAAAFAAGLFNWAIPFLGFKTAAQLALLSPAAGDRYVLTDGAHANEGAEYISGAWHYSGGPEVDQVALIVDSFGDGINHFFNSTSWEEDSASKESFQYAVDARPANVSDALRRAGPWITDFGADPSGTGTAEAIIAAVQAAREYGVNKVFVPGRFWVDDRITYNVSGNSGEDYGFPDNMELIGVGPKSRNATFGADEPGFIYSGGGSLFDTRNPNGTAFVGGWKFRNLKIGQSNANADIFRVGMLDLSGSLYTPTNSAGNPCFTASLHWDDVVILGGHGPGDGIQMCKVFDSSINDLCVIREHRRGLWAKGCDRITVAGAFESNGRHIHQEQINTFGNTMRIDCRQFSVTDPGSTSEFRYLVYDTGRGTQVICGLLEDANARAMFYLGGIHGSIIDPYFGSPLPMFELKAGALNYSLIDPKGPIGGIGAPIVEGPADPNIGSQAADYGMNIINGPRYVVDAIGRTSRIRFDGVTPNLPDWRGEGAPILFPNSGGRYPRLYVDADPKMNRAMNNDGEGFTNGGLSGLDAYAGTRSGYGMELDPPVGGVSYAMNVHLVCGIHFQPADWIRFGLRSKRGAGSQTGNFDFHIRKNGAFDGTSGASGTIVTGTNFDVDWYDFQLSGYAAGDNCHLSFINGSDKRIIIDCLDIFITEDRIVDFAAAASYADLAAARADVQALAAHINKYLGTVRTRI